MRQGKKINEKRKMKESRVCGGTNERSTEMNSNKSEVGVFSTAVDNGKVSITTNRPQKTRRWCSPKPCECDICRKKLGEYFIDGRMKQGSWAIMCLKCHKEFGIGLGLSRGQMYSTHTLEKVEG